MSILKDDEETESDKEIYKADEVEANNIINEVLTKINTGVSTSNASVETTIEIPIVSNVIPMHTSPLADVQELDARALSTKKNIPREKPINVQALADMKWFKHIQRFSAPESDPLGHLPKHMDFLVAHVHNLGKSLLDKFVDYVNSVLPRLIIDALEERLPELFSDTTKNHFSQLPSNQSTNSSMLDKLECTRFSILESVVQKSIHKNVRGTMGEVPSDQLVFNAKHLTTKVNKTTTDMNELLREPQSSGTLDDPNALDMVVQSEAEHIEEPPVKKFKVMMDITTCAPLNSIKTIIIDNIPFDQFSTNLFDFSLLKKFRTLEEGPMPIEEVALQLQEMKRLANLKTGRISQKKNSRG
ncbi:hypothetical protein Tco_0809480 [Tanacetum coccineum]